MNPIVPALNMVDLGNLVRGWVEQDTTVERLNKEVQSARVTRQKYETEILRQLKMSNYPKAIIQIGGGRIVVNDEKHSQPLTFKLLEEILHEYYRIRPATVQNRDETGDILKFIKSHRRFETLLKLKRQMS